MSGTALAAGVFELYPYVCVPLLACPAVRIVLVR